MNKSKVEFRSPTVNLFIDSDPYIKFISNFRHYVNLDIIFNEVESDFHGYIVGYLDDIKLHFMHFESKYDVVSSWKRRSERIPDNNDEILFEISDRDGFSDISILNFSRLPYKNKIGFLKKGRFENIINSNIFFEIDSNENCCPSGDVLAGMTYETIKKIYTIK